LRLSDPTLLEHPRRHEDFTPESWLSPQVHRDIAGVTPRSRSTSEKSGVEGAGLLEHEYLDIPHRIPFGGELVVVEIDAVVLKDTGRSHREVEGRSL
jgi:hypothetical protein